MILNLKISDFKIQRYNNYLADRGDCLLLVRKTKIKQQPTNGN